MFTTGSTDPVNGQTNQLMLHFRLRIGSSSKIYFGILYLLNLQLSCMFAISSILHMLYFYLFVQVFIHVLILPCTRSDQSCFSQKLSKVDSLKIKPGHIILFTIWPPDGDTLSDWTCHPQVTSYNPALDCRPLLHIIIHVLFSSVQGQPPNWSFVCARNP